MHVEKIKKALPRGRAHLQKIAQRSQHIRSRLNRTYLLIGGAILGGFFVGFIMWTSYGAQKLPVSFSAQTNCVSSPRIFAGGSRFIGDSTYELYRPSSLSIGNWSLFARTLCARPVKAPKANLTYTYNEKAFGLSSRRVVVEIPGYPKLQGLSSTKRTPPEKPLQITLDSMDRTFSYIVRLDKKTAPCIAKQMRLECDLAALDLRYAQTYRVDIVREFKGEVSGVAQVVPIQTITPTRVVSTTIQPGAELQDKPKELNITTDKPLKSIGAARLVVKDSITETDVPIDVAFSDKGIRVVMKQELPRKKTFEFTLASVEATDTSGFEERSYAMQFKTSGGPRAKGSGLASRNVSLSPTATLSFDQTLLASQDVRPHISFKANDQTVDATIVVQDNRIIVRPTAALPLCAKITITVTNKIQNQFGIDGDSAATFRSRAICYTTFSIGSSVKGRPIIAYRFGTGANLIVYVGAMHGSEQNTKRLMDEWFNELNSSPDRIPANRSIVIIPAASPDGYATGSRLNANGVDLNRNFPASDWKQSVTLPGSQTPTNAGGSAPLSEPESRALAQFITANQPRLVMTFHSKAAIVEANESGDSVAIGAQYARLARYRAVPRSQTGVSFSHDTTGAMEDWMRDRLGRPAIVVELLSYDSSEFGRNKNALWYIAGL